MLIAELSILDGIMLIPVWLGAPTRPPRDGDVGDRTCWDCLKCFRFLGSCAEDLPMTTPLWGICEADIVL